MSFNILHTSLIEYRHDQTEFVVAQTPSLAKEFYFGSGELPLHMAIRLQAPASCVKAILCAYPNALNVMDKNNNYPEDLVKSTCLPSSIRLALARQPASYPSSATNVIKKPGKVRDMDHGNRRLHSDTEIRYYSNNDKLLYRSDSSNFIPRDSSSSSLSSRRSFTSPGGSRWTRNLSPSGDRDNAKRRVPNKISKKIPDDQRVTFLPQHMH